MRPLADEIRPRDLDEVVGQKHILGPDGLLRRVIESGNIPNMVFYGPSGTGKTTVANIIAQRTERTLRRLNATNASLSDIKDIIAELQKPGRDPREDMPRPVLRSDVLDIKDLKEGMVLKGTVRNVIDFGAFVDIGVHQDGLVHISQLTDKKFVKHPLEVVSVGDVVEVKVLNVDAERKRIGLTMIL